MESVPEVKGSGASGPQWGAGATPLLCFADLEAAAARIALAVHRTLVVTSRLLDAATGGTLFLKAENLQRTGSFKLRGATNAIALLPRGQGVVAFSSGNHAQAVAWAAKAAGVPAVIVMPHDAPAGKRAATAGYGAEIVGYDRYSEDREAIARELAQRRGLALVPPFDHADVLAGQGTAAMELLADVPDLDLLLVPLGGGGLLAGSVLAAEAMAPGCRVMGVEPEAGNDGQRSLREGRRVKIAVPRSIADGALTTMVGALNFAVLHARGVEVETVPDDALVEAMRFAAERLKMVVEPTGCLGLACAMRRPELVRGRRVGVVLSGGNVDLGRFGALMEGQGLCPRTPTGALRPQTPNT